MTRREFLNLLKGFALGAIMPQFNWPMPVIAEPQPELAGQMPMTVPYTIAADPLPIITEHALFIPMVST